MSRKPPDMLAREHAEQAIDTIADIMNDPFEEARDRLRASEMILDRGYGKAAQAIIAVPANRAVAEALARMSDDELMQIINDKEPPRLLSHDNAIDAEFTVQDPLLL